MGSCLNSVVLREGMDKGFQHMSLKRGIVGMILWVGVTGMFSLLLVYFLNFCLSQKVFVVRTGEGSQSLSSFTIRT